MNEYESRWQQKRTIDEGFRAAMPWVFGLLLSIGIAAMVLSENVAIASGMLAGAVVLAAVFMRPEVALVAVTIVAPLEIYMQQVGSLIPGSGITPVNAVCILLILSTAIQRMVRAEPATDATTIDRPLLFFVAWTAISIVIGTMTWYFDQAAIGEWLQFASAFMMYWVARRRFRSEKLAKLAVLIICALVVFESVEVMRQYLHMNTSSFNWELKREITGTFPSGNSNDIATYLSVYAMVALGLFLSVRRAWWRWLALGVFVLAGAATFETYSRAAYIALAAGVLAVTLYKHNRYLVPALIVMAVLPSVLPSSISERLSTSGDQSAENRKEYWKNGISLMLHHPQGVGWRGYAMNETARGQKIRDPHSMFVLVAAEQGMVGFALFLGLLAACGREIVKSIRRAKTPFAQGLGVGMFGALIALCINSLFGSRMMWFYSMQHFWLLLGLLVMLTNGPPGTVVEVEPEPVAEEKPVSPWRYRSYV